MTDLPLRWANKDPADVIVRGIDGWRAHLDLPQGVTLDLDACHAEPAGLTLTGAAFADDKASVRIAAGANGIDYLVTFRLTASDGQTVERSAKLFVTDL